MSARVRAGLLWGVVSALAFLVLLQGYVLAGGRAVGLPVAVGVAVLVGTTSGAVWWVLAPVIERRLRAGRQ